MRRFRRPWAGVTAQAAAGDTIFVTYARHGGQEREALAPLDAADGRDETVMFADFDPKNPRVVRLNDDQIYEMLRAVPQFKIIWGMDSCNAGGLERAINPNALGRSRSGGVWDIPINPLPTEVVAGAGESGATGLAHVTQSLATATDDLLVTETGIDGKPHGALSWFLAKTISGEADQNNDGAMTRLKIVSFIGDRVFTHMEQNQQPRFVPRGDALVMLNLSRGLVIEAAPKATATGLPIRLVGAPPPGRDTDNCPGCRAVAAGWDVYSGQGDRITTITANAPAQIARAAFLIDLNAAKQAHLPPVVIGAMQSAARQTVGSKVGCEFRAPSRDLPFVTLFNAAFEGSEQYPLYPPGFAPAVAVTDALTLQFAASPPSGEDQRIVIWCARPPLGLQDLLVASTGKPCPRWSIFGPPPPIQAVNTAALACSPTGDAKFYGNGRPLNCVWYKG